MPRYACPNCKNEYLLSNEEYRSNRFCRNCKTKLTMQQEQQQQQPDRLSQIQKPDEKNSGDNVRKKEEKNFERNKQLSYKPRVPPAPLRGPVAVAEDVEKATKIASTLYDQFNRRTGFFEGYESLVYVISPAAAGSASEQGSNQLALYLTYVVATIDYQIDVDRLLEQAKVEYQRNPEMFTPEGVIKSYPNILERFVRSLGSRYPSNGAWAWKKISEILLRDYQGSPLNLTKDPVTVSTLRQKIVRFPHLKRRKLSNFYIRLMFEKGFFKIVDPENIPVVPDIQIGRVSFYTGVLKTNAEEDNTDQQQQQVVFVGNDPVRSHIEHVWSEAAKPLGVPAAYLDEALWLIGSELCTSRDCSNCPIEAFCSKNTSITFSGDSYRSRR